MQKKALLFLSSFPLAIILVLQSCNITNQNATQPAPFPTPTFTTTSTGTPTSTFTATPTTTPVACNTHVVLTVASGASTLLAGNYTYADQFNLAAQSNFNSVTVLVASASATGTGNNIQIALYSDNGSSYPGTILFNSATRALTATGPGTYIFNPTQFSLPAGTYWLAIHSTVQYQPYQYTSNSPSNFIVSGKFPDPFPAGASSANAPWSYSLDTCHP